MIVPLIIILSAAVWMATIPTVCVPVQGYDGPVIMCFERVVPKGE